MFRGSCGEIGGQGTVFIKNVNDPQFWHRDKSVNDFYRQLLRDEGDEVFQVAYIDRERLIAILKKIGTEKFGKRVSLL